MSARPDGPSEKTLAALRRAEVLAKHGARRLVVARGELGWHHHRFLALLLVAARSNEAQFFGFGAALDALHSRSRGQLPTNIDGMTPDGRLATWSPAARAKVRADIELVVGSFRLNAPWIADAVLSSIQHNLGEKFTVVATTTRHLKNPDQPHPLLESEHEFIQRSGERAFDAKKNEVRPVDETENQWHLRTLPIAPRLGTAKARARYKAALRNLEVEGATTWQKHPERVRKGEDGDAFDRNCTALIWHLAGGARYDDIAAELGVDAKRLTTDVRALAKKFGL